MSYLILSVCKPQYTHRILAHKHTNYITLHIRSAVKNASSCGVRKEHAVFNINFNHQEFTRCEIKMQHNYSMTS